MEVGGCGLMCIYVVVHAPSLVMKEMNSDTHSCTVSVGFVGEGTNDTW